MKNKIIKSLATIFMLGVVTLFTACDSIVPPPITPPPPVNPPITPPPPVNPPTTLLPDADQYNVTFILSGIGKKSVEVSRSFRHAIGNPGSCTESNVTQKYTETLDGLPITRVESHPPHSRGNNGAAWIENFIVGSTSVVAVYHYDDKGRGFFGDCKGNGWIDQSFTLFSTKQEEFTLKSIQESKTIQAGVAGSVTVSYPLDQLVGLNSLNWIYTIEITAIKGGVATGSLTLTNAQPSSGQFSSFISNQGQLVLSLE
jgi:hypothetical protein